MKQRGRKSKAQLSVPEIKPKERPEPPECLTEEEAEEWRAIVGRMPADWFQREHYPALENLCRHAVASRMAEGSDLARESRAVLACMRALRLTHQAQYDAAKADRSVKRAASGGPAPWE